MNKQEHVYRVLRERILEGQYGPGYRLVIDAIAEELGYSALPVREAIRRLEAEGLAIFRPNAGAQVKPADPAGFAEGLATLAVLEGFATAEAAKAMTAEDLAAVEHETDLMVECMETLDVSGYSQANKRFHEYINARCNNASLLEMINEISQRSDVIRRTVFTQIPYRGRSSIAEHRAIIELIRNGAPSDEIEKAARTHKLRTVEAFRSWQKENAPGDAVAGMILKNAAAKV
ncbi:GntR family transcriptional regulator [Streptomyces sp. NBC_00258]|nr:GntR family transcriptional regulator [Streptomyces sp. NBC_00258]